MQAMTANSVTPAIGMSPISISILFLFLFLLIGIMLMNFGAKI